MKLTKNFFLKPADKVAKNLLGKILCRKIDNKIFRAKIIETEAYFGEKDPASWARFGKRKSNILMWDSPGKILIKNVHKYKMLNFITGKKDEASAVLIRALEPLNFNGRCSMPPLSRPRSVINQKNFLPRKRSPPALRSPSTNPAQKLIIKSFSSRSCCSGPGLLTNCLKIDKTFNGQEIIKNKKIWIEEENKKEKFKIFREHRIGVKNDLKEKLRFYLK